MEPCKTEQTTVRLDARIPVQLKESLTMAAALTGRSQTDFIIAAVSEATKKVIAEHSLIRLCLEDQKTLAQSLLGEAAKPSPQWNRLRQALKDHSGKVESR